MTGIEVTAILAVTGTLALAAGFLIGKRVGVFKASGSADTDDGIRWSVELDTRGEQPTVTIDRAPAVAGKLAAPAERVVVPLEVQR